MEEMIQAIIDELQDEATIEVSYVNDIVTTTSNKENGLLIIKALWGNETRKLELRPEDDFHVIADWATELINDMQDA